ncbi:hypothetical protein PHYBOEH_002589 [Phytophthora boehmeriae]|uniref:Protein ENHANCED DISEASE RESISTANCE 2 C-terminal domain-containing protein n=1 Tax=Phytophthora boehmeriae TaxID=109152 RepID=A0A8T1WWL5_9STRA|nr:hypothetical protein PHYBOEH_002589 [Phytophthora boehmeriae]
MTRIVEQHCLSWRHRLPFQRARERKEEAALVFAFQTLVYMSVVSPLHSRTDSLSSIDSNSEPFCRRKSCTRAELEWSCGHPPSVEPSAPMEMVNCVTVEDLDEYIEPEETKKETELAEENGCASDNAPVTAEKEAPEPEFAFEDAPFAVHCHEIRKMWSEPDASNVEVRGKTYMDDQVKVPAGQAIGKLLHVDLWKFDTAEERHHLAMREETRPNSVLAYCREKFPNSKVFILNIQLPNADNLSLMAYWLLPPARKKSDEGTTAFNRLLTKFCEDGDDEFRDNRFKLIPNLVEGPWLLQSLVPNRPALTGTKLTQRYFRRSNYFELDLDVSSSTTAQYIGSACQSWASYLQMHLYLTIQGENEDELQERVLGSIDVSYLDLELAKKFD